MPRTRSSAATRRALSRRRFLKAAGVGLALPMLNAMRPAFAKETPPPRRVLSICNNLGLIPEKFFPEGSGRSYKPSPYLELLAAHRNDFTVFSGVWHPDVDGGHPADNCFLTAAPHPGSGGFRNTISLDQYVAERQGHLTRFPSLTLGVISSFKMLLPVTLSRSSVFATSSVALTGMSGYFSTCSLT